jgi:metal-dependent amidase/aminoacylase/carboxypeptidase family protein
VDITTLPGYMPLENHLALGDVFRANAETLVGTDHYTTIGHRTGSTDMGDLGQIMPVVQGYIGGATGTGHGADYDIVNPQLAYLGKAKVLAMSVIDLLWADAHRAQAILRDHTPPLGRTEYLAYQRGINRTERFDGAA